MQILNFGEAGFTGVQSFPEGFPPCAACTFPGYLPKTYKNASLGAHSKVYTSSCNAKGAFDFALGRDDQN